MRKVPEARPVRGGAGLLLGCIKQNKDPEPSGIEGLADVRIIRALLESAEKREWVELDEFPYKRKRPTLRQEIQRPPTRKPRLVHAESPTIGS